jgi:hypothetical protein
MWLFTTHGFYSIVHKPWSSDGVLTVRGRDKSDLEILQSALKMAGEITEDQGADYHYRFEVHSADLAALISQEVERIDYDNFKNKVAEVTPGREITYGRVWAALRGLQLEDPLADREEDESGSEGEPGAQIRFQDFRLPTKGTTAFEDTVEELGFEEEDYKGICPEGHTVIGATAEQGHIWCYECKEWYEKTDTEEV